MRCRKAQGLAITTQTQVRCGTCNRRLADLINMMDAGQIVLEFKCPRCGDNHLEIVRPAAAVSEIRSAS